MNSHLLKKQQLRTQNTEIQLFFHKGLFLFPISTFFMNMGEGEGDYLKPCTNNYYAANNPSYLNVRKLYGLPNILHFRHYHAPILCIG